MKVWESSGLRYSLYFCECDGAQLFLVDSGDAKALPRLERKLQERVLAGDQYMYITERETLSRFVTGRTAQP